MQQSQNIIKGSTIERRRTQRAPFGDPTKSVAPLIHRVRNEATEKQYSNEPWCGFSQAGDTVTILNCDVTCPACIEVIGRLQVERGEVDLTDEVETEGDVHEADDLSPAVIVAYRERDLQLREAELKALEDIAETLRHLLAAILVLAER